MATSLTFRSAQTRQRRRILMLALLVAAGLVIFLVPAPKPTDPALLAQANAAGDIS